MLKPLICLASASPRRRDLLEQIGVAHRAVVVPVDESPRPGEVPELYVVRLALAKAQAVAATADAAGLPVLGADTAVVIDGTILGKPRDAADAGGMLARLAGRCHAVYTGVALLSADSELQLTRLSVSHVRMRSMSAAEIAAYWASGEPVGKAGAYAIQGRAAAFIESLEGSFSGVMGLPLFETAELLREVGIDVSAGWGA